MSQQPVVAEIALDVTLEYLDSAGHGHLLDAVLGYHRSAPFAVSLTFPTAAEPVSWRFGRDLLIRGLLQPAGDGDVRVSPATNRGGRAVVLITLCSPDGHVLLEARTDHVVKFLERTLALVPIGAESTNLDLDEVIAHILGDRPGR